MIDNDALSQGQSDTAGTRAAFTPDGYPIKGSKDFFQFAFWHTGALIQNLNSNVFLL